MYFCFSLSAACSFACAAFAACCASSICAFSFASGALRCVATYSVNCDSRAAVRASAASRCFSAAALRSRSMPSWCSHSTCGLTRVLQMGYSEHSIGTRRKDRQSSFGGVLLCAHARCPTDAHTQPVHVRRQGWLGGVGGFRRWGWVWWSSKYRWAVWGCD